MNAAGVEAWDARGLLAAITNQTSSPFLPNGARCSASKRPDSTYGPVQIVIDCEDHSSKLGTESKPRGVRHLLDHSGSSVPLAVFHLAACLAALAIIGLIYSLTVIVHARKSTGYQPDA